jgi:hypothetical protein
MGRPTKSRRSRLAVATPRRVADSADLALVEPVAAVAGLRAACPPVAAAAGLLVPPQVPQIEWARSTLEMIFFASVLASELLLLVRAVLKGRAVLGSPEDRVGLPAEVARADSRAVVAVLQV